MTTIKFSREQFERLVSGDKRATIRRGCRLSVKPGPAIAQSGDQLAVILIHEVVVKTYGDLELMDAIAEGYDTVFQLKRVLEGIYTTPPISDEEIITVIRIDEVIWHG